MAPGVGGGKAVSPVSCTVGPVDAAAAFAAGKSATIWARVRFFSVAAPTAVIRGTARAAMQPPSRRT